MFLLYYFVLLLMINVHARHNNSNDFLNRSKRNPRTVVTSIVDPEGVGSVEDLLDLEQLDSRNFANYIGLLSDEAIKVAMKGLEFFARKTVKVCGFQLLMEYQYTVEQEWIHHSVRQTQVKLRGPGTEPCFTWHRSWLREPKSNNLLWESYYCCCHRNQVIKSRKNSKCNGISRDVYEAFERFLGRLNVLSDVFVFKGHQNWNRSVPSIKLRHNKLHIQVSVKSVESKIDCIMTQRSKYTGCYNCLKGATQNITCNSRQPTHVKLSCDNEEFVEMLTCSSTGTINEIHRKFNTSKPTGVCTISCGNKKKSFIIEGELMYVAHDTLTKYFNQILNSEKSITDIHPSLLPDWTSILDMVINLWISGQTEIFLFQRRENVLYDCEFISKDHENSPKIWKIKKPEFGCLVDHAF
ncbi:hypothetical protein CRE_14717 [Caenorhabditis remanei]|uniref:Phlebovirus glycoprotein G2 fusion domain-containing protein n=1 Tax=Caenorhabditis remanei TaxID=31234 RepID=E3M9Q4_CAERE|nr:hypothetical protein CRE_14717 [Caenorhabditis remanei]